MKRFIITVKHDSGLKRIETVSTDQETAISIVMKRENCPRCAIVQIKEQGN